MGRHAEAPVSRRLNTQLFTVVGPSYVPDHVSEFARTTDWSRAQPRQPGGARNWLVLGAVVTLLVVLANIGTIVHATTRQAKPAPIFQNSGGAPSFGAIGGIEANRW